MLHHTPNNNAGAQMNIKTLLTDLPHNQLADVLDHLSNHLSQNFNGDNLQDAAHGLEGIAACIRVGDEFDAFDFKAGIAESRNDHMGDR